MRSRQRTPPGLALLAGGVLLFLHLPLLFIFLYAFSTEDRTFVFPPPGLTLHWFSVAWEREDVWAALSLSVRCAALATVAALVLGTLAAAATWRTRWFGREVISLMVILPIALPGIVTGIAIRTAFSLTEIDFSLWTIVVGHATFCVVTVYNNVAARLRRTPTSLIEASMDLLMSSIADFLPLANSLSQTRSSSPLSFLSTLIARIFYGLTQLLLV